MMPPACGCDSARRRPARRTSGLIRTALFNWAYARHTGGTFVFRLEDTDAERDSEESYLALLDALSWLGLNYDEGPESVVRTRPTGSPSAARSTATCWRGCWKPARPTRRSRRRRRSRPGTSPRAETPSWATTTSTATSPRRSAPRSSTRAASRCCGCGCPDEDITWHDLVRGDTTFAAGVVPDFALTRASGDPLYTLVNPVDDALMKITHVLRGEDLLPSTPRQIALYQALIRIGVAERVPEFAHLPSVLGDGNKKLSKRDPQSNLFIHRERGFIPEGLLNYLALLGWGIAEDRDVFSLDEMVAAFDVVDVNSNPARFDQKKADALNAEHIRLLSEDDFTARLAAYLRRPRSRHRP